MTRMITILIYCLCLHSIDAFYWKSGFCRQFGASNLRCKATTSQASSTLDSIEIKGNYSRSTSLLSSLGSSFLSSSSKSIGLEVYNEKKDIANIAANAKLERLLENEGSSDKNLISLLDSALNGRVVPGVTTVVLRIIEARLPLKSIKFTETLQLLREAGMYDQCIIILESAQRNGYAVSIQALNTVVRFGHSLSSTKQILRNLEEIGYELNAQLFYEAMSTLIREGTARDALEMLEHMYFMGIEPNASIFDLALKILSWTGNDAGMTINLLREMEFRKVEATSQCYSTVILACARLDKWEQIPILLDEMVTKQKPILESIFLSLLDCIKTRLLASPPGMNATEAVHVELTRLLTLLTHYTPFITKPSKRPFTTFMEVASLFQAHHIVIEVGKLMLTFQIDASVKQIRRMLADACEIQNDSVSALYFVNESPSDFADENFLNRTMCLCHQTKNHFGAIQSFLKFYQFTRDQDRLSTMHPKWRSRWSYNQQRILVSDAINAFAVQVPRFVLPTATYETEPKEIEFVQALDAALQLFKDGDLDLTENGVKVAVKILLRKKLYRTARRILRHTLLNHRQQQGKQGGGGEERSSLNITRSVYEAAVDYLNSGLINPISFTETTVIVTEDSKKYLNQFFTEAFDRTTNTATLSPSEQFFMQHHVAADVIPGYLTKLIKDLCEFEEFLNAQMVFIKGAMMLRESPGWLGFRSAACHISRINVNKQQVKSIIQITDDQIPFQMYFASSQSYFGSIPLPIQAYRLAALAFLEAELPQYSIELFDFYSKNFAIINGRDVVFERIIIYTLARSEICYSQAHAMISENSHANNDPFVLYCGILACKHAQQYEQALTYLKRIGTNHPLTSDHLHAVIEVSAACVNKSEEALKLLQTMNKFNIVALPVTYATVLLSLAKERKWRDVALVVQQIKNKIKMPRLPEAVAFFASPTQDGIAKKDAFLDFVVESNILSEQDLGIVGYKNRRDEKEKVKEMERAKLKDKPKKGFGSSSSGGGGGGGFGNKSPAPQQQASAAAQQAVDVNSNTISGTSKLPPSTGLPMIMAPEVTAYDYLFSKPRLSGSVTTSEEQRKILAEWEKEIMKVTQRHPVEEKNLYWWLLDELETVEHSEDWNGSEIFEQILICNNLINAQDVMYRGYLHGVANMTTLMEMRDLFANLRMIRRQMGGRGAISMFSRSLFDSALDMDDMWTSDFSALNIEGVNLKEASIAMMRAAIMDV